MKEECSVIAVTNGTVLTITNGILEEGTVLVENGTIKAVGTDIPIPEGAQNGRK